MKTKIFWAFILMISACFIMISFAEAGIFGQSGKERGMRAAHRGWKSFSELNLTDEQENEIKNIITKFREEQKALRDSLRDQRKDFSGFFGAGAMFYFHSGLRCGYS